VTWLLIYVLIGVLSVARTARLVVFDDYPPMVWLRDRWDRLTHYDPQTVGWGKLLHCAFCATPYLAVGMLLWSLAALPDSNPTDWWSAAWWWLVVNGTWGLSYIAAITVAYDQPE
jgi:hypothetical protein